ncbi:Prefoldin subunit 4 like protein [Argiope bruennichi]|uniref:Prefoldin subunit 4 n=1 Tax=Argiope bruennichi TaxID=94029 RepID=A0A8T0F9P7_ARGBR|nr:Prefoldin subunit 4 like protein [Argiope bruennichi]
MTSKTENEMHVSFEDQQKINKFARHNARLDDIIEELKSKENELQALEDAEADLMLSMDKDKVPYPFYKCVLSCDVFAFISIDEAQQMLDEKKENVNLEAKALRDQQESIKQMMSDLKVQLYAKFGNNINLEPE